MIKIGRKETSAVGAPGAGSDLRSTIEERRSMGFLRLKVTIGALAALLCAALLVAGCGSSNSTGSTESTGGETGGSEEATFTAKPKGGIPGALLPKELDLW